MAYLGQAKILLEVYSLHQEASHVLEGLDTTGNKGTFTILAAMAQQTKQRATAS